MKIKAKNAKIASMKLCVPIDGVINIDHDGIAEVSAKCATFLVKGTNDWDYLRKTVDEDIKENAVEIALENVVKSDELTEREKFENYIDGLSVSEMKNYASEGNLPAEEYDKISSKKLMKAYLLKKYDEMSDN